MARPGVILKFIGEQYGVNQRWVRVQEPSREPVGRVPNSLPIVVKGGSIDHAGSRRHCGAELLHGSISIQLLANKCQRREHLNAVAPPPSGKMQATIFKREELLVESI